jgi:hypothetical protein
MPQNWVAIFALISWPLVAIAFYQSLSIVRATSFTILGGLLLLPEGGGIKFEMIPQFDKTSIPSICALLGCVLASKRGLRLWSRLGAVEILILMYLIGPFITSALNGDAIFVSDRILPGVDYYDGFSTFEGRFLFFIPFFLGRRFFRQAIDIEEMLGVLIIAGTFYSLLMLFEIRMSPQLSLWIYGVFPSSYPVEMRSGGFRPVVFLGNGLIVSFFAMSCMLAAAAFWRARIRIFRFNSGFVAAYLGFVLILCKAAGSLIYGCVSVFLVRFSSTRRQLQFAVLLIGLGLLYPMLRAEGLFPDQPLVQISALFSRDRADSLNYRFMQEDSLLAHASERFTFGWGRFGRNRIYSDENGSDQSTTDGRWILTIGQFGMFGFIAEFGLLALPIFYAYGALNLIKSRKEAILFSALSLLVALSVIDQLPNNSLSPWSWLLIGALLGRSEQLRYGHKLLQRTTPAIVARQHLELR